MALDTPTDIERALQLVGELLQADGHALHIVIIGGAALNLQGTVSRTTRDVDVVAIADRTDDRLREAPDPLPPILLEAARTVAGDLRLPPDWLNSGPASQWRLGLPTGFMDRLHWRVFAGLRVGIADRYDLIHFKLEAAADQPDPRNRHMQDLQALQPTPAELAAAAAWAKAGSVGAEQHAIIDQVIAHVLRTH